MEELGRKTPEEIKAAQKHPIIVILDDVQSLHYACSAHRRVLLLWDVFVLPLSLPGFCAPVLPSSSFAQVCFNNSGSVVVAVRNRCVVAVCIASTTFCILMIFSHGPMHAKTNAEQY